jgi:magnesium chelatase subunit D
MRKQPSGNNHIDPVRKQKPRKLSRPAYPFVAILGQQEMKLALILNVIDPLIGGVLIMGHRGTGKSTAVRGLTGLLPEIRVVSDCGYQCDPKDTPTLCASCEERLRADGKLQSHLEPVQVVELPLGATEDRVCGSINLERAFKDGAAVLEPGLLARANRGFLYIDEVNLLEDHLVDLLLDVAASGINRVEREGISVEHPARFVLIGSGNPEEGELRPQLLDRFGLHPEVKTETDPERRVAIVELRDAFDRDPIAFNSRFADQQKEIGARIVRARRALPKTKINRALLLNAAQLCAELNIEGQRGELTLVRAARAYAAFDGRSKVSADDLKRVAPMALRHRLRQNAFEDGAATERIEQALDHINPNSSRKTKPVENPAGSRSDQSQSENGNSAKVEPPPPAAAAIKIRLPGPNKTPLRSAFEKRSSGKKKRHISENTGRHVRSVNYQTAAKRIAVAATVRAMLMMGQQSSEALRYKLFSRKHGALFVFLIDTSGSMARHRIAIAKRAILDLLRQSYVNRDRVAIVAFRGDSASVALPPSRSILRARRAIDSLIVGGGTPLSAGLVATSNLIECGGAKEGHKWVFVFTDGRANVPLKSSPVAAKDRDVVIVEELNQLGARLRKLGAHVVVANTQRKFEFTDEPKRLAQCLNAQLITVSDI